jgi:hypothetical protein
MVPDTANVAAVERNRALLIAPAVLRGLRLPAMGTWMLLVAALCAHVQPAVLADESPAPAKSTWTKFEPIDGKPIAGRTPVTFSVFFRPGEIAKDKRIAVTAGGRELPSQVDVKRSFDDGSAKHAIVSLVLPALDAAGLGLGYVAAPSVAAGPGDSAGMAQKLLAGDFDATVTLTFPDGKSVTASARQMLEAAGDRAKTWLRGPVAIEWLLMGPPVDRDGAADPDMAVQFLVRYYPETGHTRVSAVVEKCSDQGSDGGVIYDVAIRRGKARPETVFEQKGVRHCDLMRWRKVFWIGSEPPTVNPRMDVEAMIAAGVVPPYDTALKVPEKAIADYYARWLKVPKGINCNGLYRASMPDTGGHDDRGLLPRWVAMYLLSMDPRLREAVIGADEMSGNAGIHGRTSKSGRIETQDARPRLWLVDDRAGNWGTERWRGLWDKGREIQKPPPPRSTEKIKSVFTPDTAHVPALGYGAYLATGDLFFLEETYFWASYALLAYNPGYRQSIFNDGQMRGKAWGLRLGLMAAIVAPDADPEKEYFTRLVAKTYEHHRKFMESPQSHPLGIAIAPRGDGKGDVHIPPWQHDFNVLVADWAARAGFRDAAAFRDQVLAFTVGRFTAPDFSPHAGTGYWWIIAQKDKQFLTWKELYDANYPGVPRGKFVTREDIQTRKTYKDAGGVWDDYIGSYVSIARAAAAVGVRAGYPKAKDAYEFITKHSPQIVKGEAGDPTWSFRTTP